MNVLRSVLNSQFRQINLFLNLKRNLITKIDVPEYLLNRSRSASELLANLTPEDDERLHKIKIYHEYLLSSGEMVPKSLTDEHYLELLCLSKSQITKYYKFLAKNEFKKENDVIKAKFKAQKREEELSRLPTQSEHPINRFFSKYQNKILERLEINRIFKSIILQSQEIIFDLSFEDAMSRVEIKNVAHQLLYCYSLNKGLDEPFQMVLTNADPNRILYNDLVKLAGIGRETCAYKRLDLMPWIVDNRHYLDMYSDRRLIYLSPNSTNYFNQGEYDHNAIYIIGGLVDKSEKVPLTLARARREKIEHRCFPIDRFIPWKNGDKNLPLNQCMQVLSIARDTSGDWKRALEESIPRRALYDTSARGRERQAYKSFFLNEQNNH